MIRWMLSTSASSPISEAVRSISRPSSMASTSSSRLVIAAGDKGQASVRGKSCVHAPRIHPSSSTTAPRDIGINTMTTLTCLLATVLAVLTIPLVILWRLSLPPPGNTPCVFAPTTGPTSKSAHNSMFLPPQRDSRQCQNSAPKLKIWHFFSTQPRNQQKSRPGAAEMSVLD